MNRFENMQTFVRVVDAGSISGAADRLGVAKSVVSRRLKELEMHLGAALFHRTTRKMNLTETGRAFYHQSVRILDDLQEAELMASQAHGTLEGSLRVALPLSFGLMHMGPAIDEFLQKHSKIEFDIDFNDRQVDLVMEGFDLAVRIANLADSSLIARRLADIRAVMCASPGYLKRKGIPQTVDDLKHHQCLVYNLLRDFDHWHLHDANGDPVSIRIRPYLKAGNGEFLRDAAVNGLGIALLPTFIVYREIERGSLMPILTQYHCPQITAYAVYPQTRHLSRRVRVFVDFLVERFKETPYWDLWLQQPAGDARHTV
ncbi:LysR family transcriptional regulator [Nitrosomonas sp.]|uniref:LysR family transcriptional regulator n=1 Tax=Nitrosomonas sp. TaxID=42353 RepID=UPI00284BBCF2|nr:LysR family transcriptional regulator [Nitrosomonas sp.]MDR4515526.1 LysR family transcriptional regulator [Nitrosomonas sp.]